MVPIMNEVFCFSLIMPMKFGMLLILIFSLNLGDGEEIYIPGKFKKNSAISVKTLLLHVTVVIESVRFCVKGARICDRNLGFFPKAYLRSKFDPLFLHKCDQVAGKLCRMISSM